MTAPVCYSATRESRSKVVREWRIYVEGWYVPGDDIEKPKVLSAT